MKRSRVSQKVFGSILILFFFVFSFPQLSAAQYHIRLGVVVEDMSKENLDRIKVLTHAFNYKFGVDLRIVVQKRQYLLLRLFQTGSVDFILTGLPQVLALEKNQLSFKVILRSYKRDRSDSFMLLMASKTGQDSARLQFPVERFFVAKSHVILSEKTASNKLFLPDLSAHSKRLIIRDLGYSPQFFKQQFSLFKDAIVVDIRNFSLKKFGKIRSFRDKSIIEKKCKCKVLKMSVPIPDKILLVNPAFYAKRPLQTYQLMEFFLLLSDDPQHAKNIEQLFKVGGFMTATNNLVFPFSYFLTKFSFNELANWTL